MATAANVAVPLASSLTAERCVVTVGPEVTATVPLPVLLPYVAVTLTIAEPMTLPAITAVDAVVCPALTLILGGTGNAVLLLLVSITIAPKAGAGVANVTVNVALAPLLTLDGTVMDNGANGDWTTTEQLFELDRPALSVTVTTSLVGFARAVTLMLGPLPTLDQEYW